MTGEPSNEGLLSRIAASTFGCARLEVGIWQKSIILLIICLLIISSLMILLLLIG